MKFSIVTPMYNSYEKMGAFFSSLENQSYKNFEVIIVDDCSTDNSYQKVLEYTENSDLEIKLIKNVKNTGPGPARNIGLNHTNSDYTTFMDSDDYISDDCIESIYGKLSKNDIDCLIFDFIRVNNDKQSSSSSVPSFSEGFIDKKSAIAVATGSTWCKVYKTTVIKENKLNFPNLMRFEDMVFNKMTLSFCNNVYYLKKPLYFYVNNEDSIVNNEKNNSEKFVVNAFKILENSLNSKYSNELESIFIRELLYSSVLTMISRGEKNRAIKEHIKKWESKYPNWSENDNIKYFSFHQKLALKFIQYNYLGGLRLLSYLRNRT